MNRACLFVFLVAVFPSLAGAQLEKPRYSLPLIHYIKTHKELLASDALLLAASAADAASSVHCQDVLHEGCIETSPALSAHPSPASSWGLSMGVASALVALDHAAVRLANDDPDEYGPIRHLVWFTSVPIAVFKGAATWNNVRVTNQGQAQEIARARLAQ